LITIGIPVFNGENFIEKCINSVLNQTFKDFELLISDNASTDKTFEICKKFEASDKRIKYFRQSNNIGALNNFHYLLKESRGDYFAFLAVDNYYQNNYLKKCISILEISKNIVGVMGKVKIDEGYQDSFSKEKKMLKKLGLSYRPLQEIFIEGDYDTRIKICLRKIPWQLFYSLFRTEELRKSFSDEFFVGSDATLLLNIVKFGEIKTINDTTFFSYPHGESSKGMMRASIKYNSGLGKIFLFYNLTKWCFKNLGLKICLKNLHYIVRLNLDGLILFMLDIYVFIKKVRK